MGELRVAKGQAEVLEDEVIRTEDHAHVLQNSATSAPFPAARGELEAVTQPSQTSKNSLTDEKLQ